PEHAFRRRRHVPLRVHGGFGDPVRQPEPVRDVHDDRRHEVARLENERGCRAIQLGSPALFFERCYRYAAIPVTASPSTSVWMLYVPSYVFTDSRLHMWRITGYSAVMPLAPSTSRDSRAMSNAISQLLRLASEICSGWTLPA